MGGYSCTAVGFIIGVSEFAAQIALNHHACQIQPDFAMPPRIEIGGETRPIVFNGQSQILPLMMQRNVKRNFATPLSAMPNRIDDQFVNRKRQSYRQLARQATARRHGC